MLPYCRNMPLFREGTNKIKVIQNTNPNADFCNWSMSLQKFLIFSKFLILLPKKFWFLPKYFCVTVRKIMILLKFWKLGS